MTLRPEMSLDAFVASYWSYFLSLEKSVFPN